MINMNITKQLFINTLQKDIRSKALFFLLILTIILVLIINSVFKFLGDEFISSLGTDINSFGDSFMAFFFRFMGFWNFFLSIFLAINTIRSDIEGKVLNQIFSFPTSRLEYLISRILGISFIVMVFYFISLVLISLTYSLTANTISFNINLLLALGVSFLPIISVISIGIFVALFFGKLVSFILSYIFILTISSSTLFFLDKNFFETLKELTPLKAIGALFYSFFPHLSYFDKLSYDIAFGKELIEYNYFHFIHLLITLFLIIFVTNLVLKKKNF